MTRFRVTLLRLLATALALVGAYACASAGASVKSPTVKSVTLRTTATTLWVVAHFKGSNGATSLSDSAGFNTSGIAPKQGHASLPAVTTADSFGFPLPSTSQAGFFCMWAGNSGGWSGSTCVPWNYTGPVIPPAPPVVDSIRVTPASFTVAATTPQCRTAIMAGNYWADAIHNVPVGVCRDSMGRPMVIQLCTVAHWSNMTWTRVSNDTGKARCQFVWDSLPLPNKVAKRLARPSDVQLAVVGIGQ